MTIVKIPYPTQAEVREALDYNTETGVFRWRKKTGAGVVIGAVAGRKRKDRHCEIRLNKRLYQAHRLAWIYVYGDCPNDLQIDHINCDPSDNRIANLRLATPSQNSANRRNFKQGSSRLRGVSWIKRDSLWRAAVKVKGKTLVVGRFQTEQAAHAAYLEKALEVFGDFIRADNASN